MEISELTKELVETKRKLVYKQEIELLEFDDLFRVILILII